MTSGAGDVRPEGVDSIPAGGRFRWGRRDWAIVFGVSLASHLYNGIEYGVRAHSTQLTRVFRLNDADLYPGDLFVDSLDQYCSYCWVGVAWLGRVFDVQTVLVASHVVSRFLLLAAIFELAGRMFRGRAFGYLAVAMAALRLRAIMAGEVLVDPLPTHTTFAFALLVWGMLFAWRGRAVWAGLLLGIGCLCNVMTGLPATFVAAVGFIAGRGRGGLRSGALGAAVWLVTAGPVLYWAAGTPSPDVDRTVYFQTIRELFWWHFDPLQWTWSVRVRLIGLLTVLGVGLWAARRSGFDRQIRGTLGAVGFTWLLAILSRHLPFLETFMRMQLGRTATFLVVIATCLAAGAVHRAWMGRRRSGGLVILVILLGWGAAHGRSAAAVLFAGMVIADLVSGRSWIQDVLGRRGRWLVPVSAIAFAGLFVNPMVRRVAEGGGAAWLIRSVSGDWRDVQIWARDHTRADALFVGPVNRGDGGRSAGGFRVFSRRPMWLEFDFDAILWRPDLTGELQRRYRCLEPTGLLDSPVKRIDWDALRRLAGREGIDYCVTPGDLAGDQRAVFHNETWAIVDLRPGE